MSCGIAYCSEAMQSLPDLKTTSEIINGGYAEDSNPRLIDPGQMKKNLKRLKKILINYLRGNSSA